MDAGKYVTILVGVLVSCLVLVAFVPVVSEVTATTETFTNDGVRMSPVGEDDITVSYNGDLVWTINGVEYPSAERPITQGTIMFYGVEHSTRTAYMYINSENSYSRHNVMNGDVDTIVYHGSTKTVDITTTLASNGNTYSSTYDYLGEIYYYDENGDYVWFSEKPTPAYVPENWDKFNAWSIGSNNFYAIIGNEIMVDGSTTIPEGTTTTLELSDVDGYEGIQTITTYTLNLPGQDPIDCRGYILPYQITADKTVVGSSAFNTVINLLPLVAGLGLLLAVVFLFIQRKI